MYSSTTSPPASNIIAARTDFKTPKAAIASSHATTAVRGRPESLSFQAAGNPAGHLRSSSGNRRLNADSFVSSGNTTRSSAYSYQPPPLAAQFSELTQDVDQTTVDATSDVWHGPPRNWHDESSGIAHGRLSDPSPRHDLSITDADKLEQRGVHSGMERYRFDRPQISGNAGARPYDETFRTTSSGASRHSSSDFLSAYRQLQAPRGETDRSRYLPQSHSSGNGEMSSWNELTRPQASQELRSSTLGRCSSSCNLLGGDTHSVLESVKRAADDIIRQKDTIIASLAWEKRMLLESRQPSSVAGTVGYSDMAVGMRLQELQYENASLKAKIAELMAGQKCDKDNFDKKLGATEYELRELKLSVDGQLRNKDEALKQIEAKVAEKDAAVDEWKAKFAELKAANDELIKKLSSSSRYLEGLPTADEHAANMRKLKALGDEKEKAEQSASRLEKKLTDAIKGQKSRDQLIESLQLSQTQLKNEIENLKKENEKLEGKLSADKDHMQMMQLQQKCDRLRIELDKAKKLIESKQVEMQQLQSSLTRDLKAANDRVEQETSTVTALRQALADKEGQLKAANQFGTELSREQQRLTERCLQLEDQLNELLQHNNAEIVKLQRHLLAEMSVCFLELEGLINVCMQGANGQLPDLNSLIGVRQSSSPTDRESPENQTNTVNALKFRIDKVGKLRIDLDHLRSVISEKFAEEFGRRLTCNPS